MGSASEGGRGIGVRDADDARVAVVLDDLTVLAAIEHPGPEGRRGEGPPVIYYETRV